jgi:hypothetical protein
MINFKRVWVIRSGRSKSDLRLDYIAAMRTEFYYLPSVWEIDKLSVITQKLSQLKTHGFRFWLWSKGYQKRLLEISICYIKTSSSDGGETIRVKDYYFAEPLEISFAGGADKLAPEAMDEFAKSFPVDAAELALARKDLTNNNLMGNPEDIRLLGVPWEPFAGSFRDRFLKEISK